MSGIPVSILATCEVVILCLGGFALFRHWGNSLSEACAYALITPLMLLSALFQLTFITGVPPLTVGAEVLVILLAGATIYRLRATFREGVKAGRAFIVANPVSCGCAFLLGIYLLLTGFVLPPEPGHWPGLATVLYLQKSGSVSAMLSASPPAATIGALPPLNVTILSHLFLRFHTDLGIGLFGFMAYLSIGFSTYALARRYAWPPSAFTVALVVVSMPKVVLLATTPGLELLPAAAALFCLLAVYRAIEHPNRRDLFLMMCALLFTVSGSAMDAAFPAVMLPLSALLLFRRHGFITWWNLLASRIWVLPIALAVLLLYSQLWLAGLNMAHQDRWFATAGTAALQFNADGIQGALANLVRYGFSSAHFTRPFDMICNWTLGFTVSGALQRLYEFALAPLLGNLGATGPFGIHWLPDERFSWFGPFGFLLVLPAVGYAAIRAPRRLKAIAVGLMGYFFLVVLVAAWCPENVRFFTLFYVCCGFTLALFLPPWYVSPAGRRRLQEVAIVLVLYASVFNLQKPALTLPSWLTGAKINVPPCSAAVPEHDCHAGALPLKSAWLASNWGRDRLEPSTRLFGDHRVAEMIRQIPDTASPGVVARNPALAYPFLMTIPRAVILRTATIDHPDGGSGAAGKNPYVMFIDHDHSFVADRPDSEVLWRVDRSRAPCGGMLIRFTDSVPARSRP